MVLREVTSSELRGAVPLAHLFLRERVRPGDRVADATCGNGNDTLLLARLVGTRGRVFAFDLQEGAIRKTRELLAAEGLLERVELLHAGHERLAELVGGPLHAAVFNLGYLPGGDKGVVTGPATTLAALAAALGLLAPGGLLLVVIYTGHPGAREEEEAVLAWGAGLDPRGYNVWTSRQANRSAVAPYLLLVEDRRERQGFTEGTTMADETCACGGDACPVCSAREGAGYWCDVCGRPVPEKRCPLCGLKARKIRESTKPE